jgi:phosphinothricin acetyltransferase
MPYVIDTMKSADWDAVRAIYLEGIATGNATFERTPPSWEKWDTSHLPFARLVARSNGHALGWGALSPVSSRCCYGGVAEVSIYVGKDRRGQGIGAALLRAMIDQSEKSGIWTLQAGIFPENVGSLALVRKCGFREIGRRERLGQMEGVWRDVLLLERRSPVVGL